MTTAPESGQAGYIDSGSIFFAAAVHSHGELVVRLPMLRIHAV
jgi:hypothetical protein